MLRGASSEARGEGWSGHTRRYSQAPREEGGMWELASPGAVIYGQESGLMSAEVRSTVEPRAVGSLTRVRVSVSVTRGLRQRVLPLTFLILIFTGVS